MVKNTEKILVLIACHKPYILPKGECYQPVEVGAELHSEHLADMLPDNTGENISARNKNYCELTALYWAWKNLHAQYIGLVHYRRYFGKKHNKKVYADSSDFEAALSKSAVILPKKRNYYIETNYSQYVHAHNEIDLTVTRSVLSELFPAYLPAYDDMMKRTCGHRFNMFVMREDLFHSYCEWLFKVLFTIEQRLDIGSYDAYNARVFGFLAERLLDCWIETNQISYTELPVMNTESQHWLRKGSAFLKRKFFPKKSY